MTLRNFLLAAATLAFMVVPSIAQHGDDALPPDGANPTAQSVNEQRLLQELNKLEGRISIPDAKAAILQQPQGRSYQFFHERLLPWVGAILILGMLLALAAFFLLRGRIDLDTVESGVKIKRFNVFARLIHWLTATAFIVLAITGLNYVFGKRLLFPLIGPEPFATWSQWAKYAHNTMALPFMLGLLCMMFVWIRDNIPDRYDWRWIKEFGGFTSGRHPPARRFNAGQKVIFWSVAIFGLALSISGILMLFPFWSLDINGMQWTQYVHAFSGALLIAIMLAHIYIGSLGMRGAYDAMGSGDVDLAWARAHHSVWVEEQPVRGHPDDGRRADVPAE